MLTSVYSPKNKRYGVIDDQSNTVIIPIAFKSVSIQKYGIVAEEDNGMSSRVYSNDGRMMLRTYKNVILLRDNYLITFNPKEKALYIVDYVRSTKINYPLHSVYLFIGNNEVATKCSSPTDFQTIIESENFIENGAHFEQRIAICSAKKQKWAVWDCKTKKLQTDFIYPAMVQSNNDRIMVRVNAQPTLI